MISGRQCRAARAWLGWSQWELVRETTVYRQKVIAFEKEEGLDAENQKKIHDRLILAGVTLQKDGSISLEH